MPPVPGSWSRLWPEPAPWWGTPPGWTYDDYYAALATMPEGCEGFDVGMDRNTMLTLSLALDMASFVDWGSGACHFDSEDFIDVLEFAKQFPDKSYYENYEFSADDSASARIAQGKQMLTTISFTGTNFILYDLDTMFGGSATCIGYPTNNGVGNVMSMGESFAMSSSLQGQRRRLAVPAHLPYRGIPAQGQLSAHQHKGLR